MSYQITISGRSTGGTGTLVRILKIIQIAPRRPVNILVEAGEFQEANRQKVIKEKKLYEAVSGKKLHLQITLEQ